MFRIKVCQFCKICLFKTDCGVSKWFVIFLKQINSSRMLSKGSKFFRSCLFIGTSTYKRKGERWGILIYFQVPLVDTQLFYRMMPDIKEKIRTRLKSKVFSLDILILLIWTNVPRTNVAQTNVVVTVLICCICSKDPLFKI